MVGATVGTNLARELARDPLPVGASIPWGHTPCVPGRGWRGAVPPLTPNGNGARHERRTRRAGLTLADLVRCYRGKWGDAPARKLHRSAGLPGFEGAQSLSSPAVYYGG